MYCATFSVIIIINIADFGGFWSIKLAVTRLWRVYIYFGKDDKNLFLVALSKVGTKDVRSV